MLGKWRREAIGSLLVLLCCVAFAAPARADEQIDVGPSPILNVNLVRGKLTIQTWERQQVLISSAQPMEVHHMAPADVDPRIPKQLQIASQRVQTENGPVSLSEESFVLPELPGSEHDAVIARGSGRVVITVPRGTAMILAHLRTGHLTIDNYRGVFIARVRGAGISLDHVAGTGFVETMRGKIVATDSNFDRLRVRTATGDMLFKNCTAEQIQATSTYGSIVYDDGYFQPGLARFESEHGDVALGVRGGAQIGAYSGSGHVVSSFDGAADVHGDPNAKQATVGGGGPVVTATSKQGTVFLYNGSMDEHPRVREELSGSERLPTKPPPRPPFRRLRAGHRTRR